MEEEIAGEGVEGFERKNISSFFSKIEGKLGQRVPNVQEPEVEILMPEGIRKDC